MIKRKDINILLLLNLMGLAIVVSFISNTQITTICLKLGINLGLLWVFKRYIKAEGIEKIKLFNLVFTRKTNLFLLCLIFLPAISCFYSTNPSYGGVKLLNLILGSFPLLILFISLVPLYNERIVFWFNQMVLFWTGFLVLMLIILQPIRINGVYHFSLLHWSHVMIGRILFCLYLITLGLLIKPQNNRKIILLFSISLISYGIFITGLRAAMLGMVLFSPVYLGWACYKRKLSLISTIAIGLWLFLSCSIAIVTNHNNEVNKRISVVKNIQFDAIQKEGSYRGRSESLQICMERFKKAPIMGIGFGGFYHPWKNYKAWVLKYPHNIILEYGVEMGLIGLLWLFTAIWLIGTATWKLNPLLCLFFAGVFWLTLFSKNIPSNILLFLGAGYYCMKPGSYYFTEA